MFAASKTASVSGYQISRSLRFNIADSTNLSRTPASSGNQKIWTWSGWLKRSELTNGQQAVFSIGAYPANLFEVRFDSGEVLTVDNRPNSTTANLFLATSAVYRDASAWYHIVFALDTTQATASNRAKLYVNGQQVTAFSTATYPSQNDNLNMNTAVETRIGSRADNNVDFGGYQTECYFIDGTALTPSSFGETSAQTGVWQPKAFTGTYGTNGFYLNFSDNSNTTAATLGKDYSGNGNNWTPNNFSVSAGAGNDSLVDSPTSYGGDSGAGGTVRGNYATLNPIGLPYATGTASNGNLDWVGANVADKGMAATIAMDSGKWYWECSIKTTSGSGNDYVGIVKTSGATDTDVNRIYLRSDGQCYKYNTFVGTFTSFTTNDIVGVAYDYSAQTLAFYKNGTLNLTVTSVNLESNLPWVGGYTTTDSWTVNFGQRAFAYTAPSGFKALCTQNLPTPTIGATSDTQAGKYFNTVLYTGNGTGQSITGVGFQPDWTWIKSRSNALSHALYDAVRGVQKQIISNSTAAETTETTGLTAFGSDGFTTGVLLQINTITATYVAWNWIANGAGSTNTSGSITSTVSANTTSGFSIVKWAVPSSPSGSNTIGHGLGVAPTLIISKSLSSSGWPVYTSTTGAGNVLFLHNTNASASNDAYSSTPSSSVFTVSYSSGSWTASTNQISYCFAPIAGYSAFGSYTGNGSADGPFVFTGFRPAYILIKSSSNVSDWIIFDVVRNTYNVVGYEIYPNSSAAEAFYSDLDILSNGFKHRQSGSPNSSGATYIYMAFASNPFKYSLAR